MAWVNTTTLEGIKTIQTENICVLGGVRVMEYPDKAVPETFYVLHVNFGSTTIGLKYGSQVDADAARVSLEAAFGV